MQSTEQPGKQTSHREIYFVITYGICFISLGLGMASLGPLLPYLAENVGVSLAQISFLFTASSLGYLLGSAGGGRLYDRFKGHTLMVVALLMMVLMSILIPLIGGSLVTLVGYQSMFLVALCFSIAGIYFLYRVRDRYEYINSDKP